MPAFILVHYSECGCVFECVRLLCLCRGEPWMTPSPWTISSGDVCEDSQSDQAEVWDDFRLSLLSVSTLRIPAQPASDYQELVVLCRECNKEGRRELREQRKGSSPGCGDNSAQHICWDYSLGTSCGFLELIEYAAPANLHTHLSFGNSW